MVEKTVLIRITDRLIPIDFMEQDVPVISNWLRHQGNVDVLSR